MDKNSSFLSEYVEAAGGHMEASFRGDHRKANQRYRVLKKLFGRLQQDTPFAEIFLWGLFQHESAAVRTWAAAHALGLRLHTEEAIEVLERVAREEQSGIVGLSAQLTVKEWRRRGELTF
jgi:hypothetical protein